MSEPIFTPQFGMNKRGMQSDILASPELQEKWATEWQNLAQVCRDQVGQWAEEGMHKQHANRPLEWFGWIDVLITATSWRNFFELRISEYAQPEFDQLAWIMLQEMRNSQPQLLQPGEWHLPYISVEDLGDYGIERCKQLSTARCARLSYKPFDGKGDIEAEIERHDSLVVARPVHASPAEHQCTPDTVFASHQHGTLGDSEIEILWDNAHLHGNLSGWIQYRKTLPHEAIMEQYS